MGDERRQQVTGTVPVPPERLFALLADPARHTELDGAAMLRGLDDGAAPVTAVGDAFVMRMNQDGLGDDTMRNEVTAFEPGRRIAWAPAIHPPGSLAHLIGDLDPSGHVYAWDLEPTGDGGTRVTHTYDWSGVRDEKAVGPYPRVSADQMRESIARLAAAAD
jgi:uncharacterized protein YndB with AHSA1/START domain